MRFFLPALMLTLAVPAMAQDRDAAISQRIMTELNQNGPLGYIGMLCDRLNGVPIWGGVSSPKKRNVRELTGSGVKLTCGADGRVERGELKAGFQGPLPSGTAFTMRQKDVWKTLKKRDLKKQSSKGKMDGGRFVRLNRKTPVTWKWADKKGKQNVSVILLNQ